MPHALLIRLWEHFRNEIKVGEPYSKYKKHPLIKYHHASEVDANTNIFLWAHVVDWCALVLSYYAKSVNIDEFSIISCMANVL